MRKRIISIALLVVLALGVFTACGSEKLYGGYTKTEIEEQVKSMVAAMANYSEDDLYQIIMYLEQQNDTIDAELCRGWLEVSSTQGALVGYKDFTIDQTGKTYTANMTLAFEQRDAVLTIVYQAYDMEVTSIHIEPVYTVGEKMSKAALNTVMGIGIVFAMLIIISLVIKCFEYIGKSQPGQGRKKAAEPAVVPGPIVVPGASAEEDEELVAVIAAAIAAATGRTTDDFVVRTIRRR